MSTAESTDPDLSCGGVLVDFDTETIAKERKINKQRMVDIKNKLMTEIYNLKQNFKDTLEASEKKMTAMFDGYMGNMLRESHETLAQMDFLKMNTLTDRITKLMNTLKASPLDQNATTSPPRKQQCLRGDRNASMDGVMQSSYPQPLLQLAPIARSQRERK
jgi:hypothetical protein